MNELKREKIQIGDQMVIMNPELDPDGQKISPLDKEILSYVNNRREDLKEILGWSEKDINYVRGNLNSYEPQFKLNVLNKMRRKLMSRDIKEKREAINKKLLQGELRRSTEYKKYSEIEGKVGQLENIVHSLGENYRSLGNRVAVIRTQIREQEDKIDAGQGSPATIENLESELEKVNSQRGNIAKESARRKKELDKITPDFNQAKMTLKTKYFQLLEAKVTEIKKCAGILEQAVKVIETLGDQAPGFETFSFNQSFDFDRMMNEVHKFESLNPVIK